MKKVHVTLGIPSEYREWRWLLSPLRREEGGLPPREEIKRIKAEALARPIATVEPASSEGGKKRHSSTVQEAPAEKKLKTSSAAREGSPAAPKIVINLSSSMGKKEDRPRFVPVTPIAPQAASSIAEKIALRRSSFVPSKPKFVPKRSSEAKFGSPSERLAAMKSDKAPLPTKVAPKSTSSAVGVDSSAEKKEAAQANKRENSTNSVPREAAEICALLKPDLLEDMDVCAKFVDGIKNIVGPSLFANHTPEYKKVALLAMMQKTTILAAESMFLDQEDTKAAKKMARTMAAEAYSLTEKIKELESELTVLKGSSTPAPTSLHLETARQEIADLKARLDAIQVKYESAEKEIECYIPQIQDLERSISEFRSAAYAKDEELIATYNQVIHFKKVVDRLEPQVLELQGALKINDNLKKEMEELQRVHACLLEENERLKGENAEFEASLTQSQADFYKLGYVDHLFGRPSDFEFSGKDLETFSVSPEDVLAFTFESSIGEVVGEASVQVGTAAKDVKAAEGMATEQP